MKKLFNLILVSALAANSTGMAIFGGRAAQLAKYAKPALRAFCTEAPSSTVTKTTMTTQQTIVREGQSNTKLPSKWFWTTAGLSGLMATGGYTYYRLQIENNTDTEFGSESPATTIEGQEEIEPSNLQDLVEGSSTESINSADEPFEANQLQTDKPEAVDTPKALSLPAADFGLTADNVKFPSKFDGCGHLNTNPKAVAEFVAQVRELLANHSPIEVVSYWVRFSRKYAIVDLESSIPAIQMACQKMSESSNRRIIQAKNIQEQVTDLGPDCAACEGCLKLISALQEKLEATKNPIAPVAHNRFQLETSSINDELICKDLQRANIQLSQSFKDQVIDQVKDLDTILEALKADSAKRVTQAKSGLFGNITNTHSWWKLMPSKPQPITTERNRQAYESYTAKKNAAYLIDPLTGYSKIAALEEVLLCYKTMLEELTLEEVIKLETAEHALKIAQNNPYGEFLLIRLNELSKFIQK